MTDEARNSGASTIIESLNESIIERNVESNLDFPFGTLAVLGLGQLGGSFALAAREAGLVNRVIGFGRGEDSLRRARDLRLADETTTSAERAVAQADTVLVSVPLRSVPNVIEQIQAHLRPGALVLDVGSVKGNAVRDIEMSLPASASFVACHPLAGTERFGPEAATAALFRGRRCIVCPTPRTRPTDLDRATELWNAIGADVVVMPAELHDQTMAAVSHLPHVAAYALAAALADLPDDVATAAIALPTTSFRDTSRVAASSPIMWRDIFLENQTALLPLLDALSSHVNRLRAAVASADGAAIEAILQTGRACRSKLLPE